MVTNIATFTGTLQAGSAAADFTVEPNYPPQLAAIGAQAVDELATLTFTATATDANVHDVLTFTMDTGAPSGAVIDPDSGVFTWTPSEAQDSGTYTATVRVSDGELEDAETITITVTPINDAPLANAGPNQLVGIGTTVQLDGSLSSDPDGNLPLAYFWTQTGGPAVALSDQTVVMPIFTAPADPAMLTFTLTVTDSLGLASAPDKVVVIVQSFRVYLPMILR